MQNKLSYLVFWFSETNIFFIYIGIPRTFKNIYTNARSYEFWLLYLYHKDCWKRVLIIRFQLRDYKSDHDFALSILYIYGSLDSKNVKSFSVNRNIVHHCDGPFILDYTNRSKMTSQIFVGYNYSRKN